MPSDSSPPGVERLLSGHGHGHDVNGVSTRLRRLVGALLAGTLLVLATAVAGHATRALSSNHSFADEIDDASGAPDIAGVNIVTNDNVSITIGMQIANRSAFSGLDWYSIALDTDSRRITGGGSDYGVAGADYVIDVSQVGARLMFWNGGAYELADPQPVIPTMWVEGYGPALRISRGALGDPESFGVMLRTTDGSRVDLAPDAGAWTYTVLPLELTAGRVAVRYARHGSRLVAETEIVRSDFEAPLAEGAVRCNARVGASTLAGTGRFTRGLAVCTWRLPKSARGHRVRGGVTATFQGVTARRAFSALIS
jgi:hypothetical protein